VFDGSYKQFIYIVNDGSLLQFWLKQRIALSFSWQNRSL